MSFDPGKYNYKFTKENYDRISVLLPKGTKREIAEKTGETINSFVNRVVREHLDSLSVNTKKGPDITPAPKDLPDML